MGELSYNGCDFSPLFTSEVNGELIQDVANRTIKYIKYTITVDGYVTLPQGSESINPVMNGLRQLLTQQGANLTYRGRGMDIIVSPGNGNVPANRDVAWGPIPKLLEFQPLGAGRSAKVKWQVITHIAEYKQRLSVETPQSIGDLRGGVGGANLLNNVGGGAVVQVGGIAKELLQFNYETNVTYDEDGFSTLSCSGTLEIPLTRSPDQRTRTLTQTADNARAIIETRLMNKIDLQRFRVTKRNFKVSRDKRTLEWEWTAEEKPYMDLPPDCTVARGTFSFRPARAGMGLCEWLCTLRATYTVRADRPRRTAWISFLALLRLRMLEAKKGQIPKVKDENQDFKRLDGPGGVLQVVAGVFTLFAPKKAIEAQGELKKEDRKAFLIDLSGDEGLYLDSKTVSFSATWRTVTVSSHILLASGMWTKLPETDDQKANLWAASVRDISGASSWLQNQVDAKDDIIVDFGM